jgi:hypothetical protein
MSPGEAATGGRACAQPIDDVIENLFAPLVGEPVLAAPAPVLQPALEPTASPPAPDVEPTSTIKAAKGKTAKKLTLNAPRKPAAQPDPDPGPQPPQPCVPIKDDPYEKRIQAIITQVALRLGRMQDELDETCYQMSEILTSMHPGSRHAFLQQVMTECSSRARWMHTLVWKDI